MSKAQLAELANADSPEGIQIPPTWPGIVAWMVARFGVGIGVAVVFGWFTVRIYADLQRQNDRILEAFQQQTVTNGEHVHAIRELAKSIEEAHRRAEAGNR